MTSKKELPIITNELLDSLRIGRIEIAIGSFIYGLIRNGKPFKIYFNGNRLENPVFDLSNEWKVSKSWIPVCWGVYPFFETDVMCKECPKKLECKNEWERLQK